MKLKLRLTCDQNRAYVSIFVFYVIKIFSLYSLVLSTPFRCKPFNLELQIYAYKLRLRNNYYHLL